MFNAIAIGISLFHLHPVLRTVLPLKFIAVQLGAQVDLVPDLLEKMDLSGCCGTVKGTAGKTEEAAE